MHLSCALDGANGGIERLSQLKGWDRMGYDCSLEIRTKTGEKLKKKKEKALKRSMVPLERLQDAVLENMTPAEIQETLALNQIDTKALLIDKNMIDCAVMIADGMARGLCANCPVCESAGLVECAGRITCWGYLGAVTKCVYVTEREQVERFAFRLPAAVAAADWCAAWMRGVESHYVVQAAGQPAKKGKRKADAAAAAGGAADGASLPNQKRAKLKDEAAGAAAKKRKPRREVPMAGSPILEVHTSYMQTGHYSDAAVHCEKAEVYNAMLNDVSISRGVNRYYVLQVLRRSSPPVSSCLLSFYLLSSLLLSPHLLPSPSIAAHLLPSPPASPRAIQVLRRSSGDFELFRHGPRRPPGGAVTRPERFPQQNRFCVGLFVWARRALHSPKRRFPARAEGATASRAAEEAGGEALYRELKGGINEDWKVYPHGEDRWTGRPAPPSGLVWRASAIG
jgi:hypothetical protein